MLGLTDVKNTIVTGVATARGIFILAAVQLACTIGAMVTNLQFLGGAAIGVGIVLTLWSFNLYRSSRSD